MAAPIPSKDTIYVDVDEEITGIIDKLHGSDAKIIALVLPKRAATLQSIVNMKLLKRAADESKKHLVLITSEAGLLPLAGLAGVMVAKTLTSKPEIPQPPQAFDDREETVDEATGETDVNPSVDGNKPVGELAEAGAITGAAAGAGTAPSIPVAVKDDVETLLMDDDDDIDEAAATAAAAATAKDFKPSAAKQEKAVKKAKKDSKLHVPNFERFRILLVLFGLLIIVGGVGIYLAFTILPKATIDITTDATNVNVNLNLTANSQVNALNASSHIVPAKVVQQQKTYSQQATPTGQQNNGTKASGTIMASAGSCSGDVPNNIPAGTALSANSLTYILSDSISFSPTVSHGKCVFQGLNSNGNNAIAITAQSVGTSYNTNGDSVPFTIYGQSNVTASGAATGGTDNIVKVVTQSDIDNAKAKISTADSTVKADLQSQLSQEGLFPITASFNAGTPTITNGANVGDTVDNFTVTEAVSYSMFGVAQNDLKTLVDNNVNTQIDSTKQTISSEGLSNATFNLTSSTATTAQLSLATVATAGPQISVDSIKKLAAGQKTGELTQQLESNPDVTNVSIKLSPFFVSSVPKKTNKITVTIAKPKTVSKAAAGSASSSSAAGSNATNP